MPYVVKVLRRAAGDVHRIYSWLYKREPSGAERWFESLNAALNELAIAAHRAPLIAESAAVKIDLRERLFKTRHGATYRIVFVIALDEVRVLRIRGPGQRPLRRRDIGL
jgi:plasmid stabilization system protein ParE